jgi:hypothetical protein
MMSWKQQKGNGIDIVCSRCPTYNRSTAHVNALRKSVFWSLHQLVRTRSESLLSALCDHGRGGPPDEAHSQSTQGSTVILLF